MGESSSVGAASSVGVPRKVMPSILGKYERCRKSAPVDRVTIPGSLLPVEDILVDSGIQGEPEVGGP